MTTPGDSWTDSSALATGPLRGLRVVDLTTYVPGPFASKVLADFGAEVVQVEPPAGDPARHLPARLGNTSALHSWLGQGKSSVALDLKDTAGKSDFADLVRSADIVIEGFTPGVAARLGVDYSACRALNPSIIYCAISGEGQNGEFASTPGHDINFVARSGLLDQLRDSASRPIAVAPLLGDVTGSLFAVAGILAAVVHRQNTGIGQFIDVSILGAAVNLAGTQTVKAMAGAPPVPGEDLNLGGDPGYRVYRTRDERFVSIGALEQKFWVRLCTELGRPDLIALRAESPAAVHRELEQIFLQRDRREWEILLDQADVCFAVVNTVQEVAGDPHVRAAGLFADGPEPGSYFPTSPVRFSETPTHRLAPAPVLGSGPPQKETHV